VVRRGPFALCLSVVQGLVFSTSSIQGLSGRAAAPRREFILSLGLLLAGLVLTRWWSHIDVLLNADSVSYARALAVFDLASYSPHPPGYVLFVLLGRAAYLIAHDSNTAYLIVNMLMQALTVVLALILFRSRMDSLTALLAVAVIVFHPLLWYYGSVLSVYTAEVAGGLVVGWAVWSHDSRPTRWRSLRLGFLWGLIGGVRQFSTVFMAPLVLWHLYRHRQRPSQIAWVAVGAIAGVLLWLVPLLKLAGGWSEYRAASGWFFALELAQSSLLFSGNSAALFWNAGTWLIAWVQLLGPMLVLIIASIRSRHGCSSTIPAPDLLGRRAFWFLWIVPAALFYLLFHMGQVGYMLTFLVPVAGLMVMTLDRELVVDARSSGRLRRALWVTLVIEVAWFAGAPAVKRGYPTASGMDYFLHPGDWPVLLAKTYRFQADYTRSGLQRQSRITRCYLSGIRDFPAGQCAIVFVYDRELDERVLAYCCPDYAVIAQAWPTRDWVCTGRPCASCSLQKRGNVTVLQPTREVGTILVIDNRFDHTGPHMLADRKLGEEGKVLWLLNRPDSTIGDDLQIEWVRD
jgi:hypothetical protein